MASANIYIKDDYKNKSGKSAVYLRVYINNQYVKIPLKIYIEPSKFDKKKKLAIGKGAKEINLQLKEAVGRASDIILKYKVQKKSLTKNLFEKEFSNPSAFQDFIIYMNNEINNRKGEITDTSIRQHKTALNKLKEFRKTIMFAELDEKLIKDFHRHLKLKLKNNDNTIFNTIKNIKTYINLAEREKLITDNPFRYFKLKKVNTYPEHLTRSERDALIDLYNSNRLPENYRKVLRWFLFACYTGLRISDLRALKHEDIRNNMISIRPQKTLNVNNMRIDIPLHKFAKKLISDENKFRVKGSVFDCFSEQRMRKLIKEVVIAAGIDKQITFHTSRHTFATLFLQQCKQANGILILQKLLGHSKLESTMVYLHVLDDDIRTAIHHFQ